MINGEGMGGVGGDGEDVEGKGWGRIGIRMVNDVGLGMG